jgi:hypothetical protein
MIHSLQHEGRSPGDILTQRYEKGLTLCLFACLAGQLSIVDLLVELGASINEKDSF